ncbi:synaptotagmin-16 isoform X2 [Hippocampus zosterae]|uniref:synaptotagmin-16 isoform X2 n=1 Tax=Hippocampus zosterae TaxID=109293 RepID=UPI00223C8D57|nr:synaptotagmin-16 isoform X2 [Hippocampus zosterae]
MAPDSCPLVWSDRCVLVCPLFLPRAVSAEAVGFLSAVGVFIAALALVFLFINKMLCFSRVGGAPCLERSRRSRNRRSPGLRQGLVRSRGAEDDGGPSSSDSDNRVMKQFEISVSRAQSLRGEQPPGGAGGRRRDKPPGAGLSHRQDDFPPAVTEATNRRELPNEPEEGPSAPERPSGAVTQESPAPSVGLPPITSVASEDLEAGRLPNGVGSPAWTSQEPRPSDAAPPPPTGPLALRPVSKCCDLLVSLQYRAAGEKLLVTVVSARDLPDRRRSGADAWQVHVVLLPAKKQKHKTSLRRPGPGPDGGPAAAAALAFGQTFTLTRVEASRLAASALRFRMYALEGRMSRRRMMGEKVLPLAGVDRAGGSVDVLLALAPGGGDVMVAGATGASRRLRSASSAFPRAPDFCSRQSADDSERSLAGDDASSLARGADAPELLMGLSYSAATGRMSVEIVKGSRFRNMAAGKPPDTYARLTLLNSVGREISRCKTSLRRAQPNPVYKETFVFQVALFQLSDVTLVACVYGRRGLKRKEMIGWAALGQNSSGEEERLHWRDMKEARGTQVCRWHVLLEA